MDILECCLSQYQDQGLPETVFILALKNLTFQVPPSALGKPSLTKLPSSSASFGFSETATPFLPKDLTLALPLGMYFLLSSFPRKTSHLLTYQCSLLIYYNYFYFTVSSPENAISEDDV